MHLTGNAESAFLAKEFTNWKDATRIFAKHEPSVSHKDACAVLADKHDISVICFQKKRRLKRREESHISIESAILSSISCPSRPAVAWPSDGDELESNLYQLLLLRGEDHPDVKEYLDRQKLKFTAHEVQNELLSIMSMQVL